MITSIATIFPAASKSYRHYVYTYAYPNGIVFYVGKGVGKRIYQHEYEAKKGINSHKCNIIRKIWNNGEKVIKTKLAYFATHEEAIEYERALIFLLPNLANLTEGGEGTIGIVFSEERIQRLRESHMGHSPSQETRQKMRESQLGKKMSEESIQRTRAHNAGRLVTEETRQRLSLAKLGKKQSDAQKQKRREYRHTEEARQKMSQANMGRVFSEERKRKISEAAKERHRLAPGWNKRKSNQSSTPIQEIKYIQTTLWSTDHFSS